MLRKLLFVLVLQLICAGLVFSQHITRIAVVDLPRVYTTFLPQSNAVRDFNRRSQDVQNNINRMNTQIQTLRASHAEAIARDNQRDVARLEAEINQRTEQLRTYHQNETARLERERRELAQSNSFLTQVNNEIRFIAESEGYSMVIDVANTPSIIWFSPSVDITDRLIQRLQASSR
ncbi:MAG: OmpH family outer membrane protein [Treponema sp.]|nr:OmpH family outer membrane protein [Treponema sp.]